MYNGLCLLDYFKIINTNPLGYSFLLGCRLVYMLMTFTFVIMDTDARYPIVRRLTLC